MSDETRGLDGCRTARVQQLAQCLLRRPPPLPTPQLPQCRLEIARAHRLKGGPALLKLLSEWPRGSAGGQCTSVTGLESCDGACSAGAPVQSLSKPRGLRTRQVPAHRTACALLRRQAQSAFNQHRGDLSTEASAEVLFAPPELIRNVIDCVSTSSIKNTILDAGVRGANSFL